MLTLLLTLLYPLAVQIERGGAWRLLAPVTLLALLIDVLANYTELALLTWDWPRAHEYTFSTRLKRLKRSPGWRGRLAQPVVAFLNHFAPNGAHV